MFVPGSTISRLGKHASRPNNLADVYLLCYKISDPASLFSAVNNWCPSIRAVAPAAPIVLVGCQSDLRYGEQQLNANVIDFFPRLKNRSHCGEESVRGGIDWI